MTKNDLARELVKHSAIGWGLAAKVGNRPAGCVQASLHKEIDQQWFGADVHGRAPVESPWTKTHVCEYCSAAPRYTVSKTTTNSMPLSLGGIEMTLGIERFFSFFFGLTF